jgi:hypothetical protein
MHIYPEFLALKIVLSRLPYFYIIQHIASGVYYAGYKCRKPNSLTFLKPGGYQTSSRMVKNIIAKEGLDSFKVLRIRHFKTKEEALDYETRFLKKAEVPHNPHFLNRHVAMNFGHAGKKFTNKTKAKMAASHQGRKMSEETKAKISASKLGKNRSAETITKMRAAMLGKKHNKESKEKIRAAFLGKKQNPEHIAKRIAKIQLGRRPRAAF